MIDLRDIHSLTDFQRNAKQYIQRTKETQQPLVLTVNGKAEVVVQDALAYQKLLDRLEYAESVAAIRKGIEEFEQGKGRSAREALEKLRTKHGI
ncbi:type II toxin-antitoxin system Phd/YefM family antitoxin [Argonema antarcticum]|uniref:type II toxin-antitoxin system Phd/YefM family antitoxin n=1 Tax=Argonema antarcticum TaxID=2942763 RepID=UPI0020114234|nr:type II toxin-antitoxin system Phd/YefM family antitoxin [Argonema antarcticum]MCL1475939.1 type II toxin-antitoxin system Phd/YefM family antitoxin [Argonema antarcticum A004/B2]